MPWTDVPLDATFLQPAGSHDDYVVVAHLNSMLARASSYRDAGTALVQDVLQRRTNSNLAIAPILFNFRQAIELTLKLVVGQTYLSEHENIEVGNPWTHRLVDLWDPVRAWLETRGETGDELTFLDRNIRLLHELDPSSMNFRYIDERAFLTQAAVDQLAGSSFIEIGLVLARVYDYLEAIHTMRYEEAQAEAEHFFEHYGNAAD